MRETPTYCRICEAACGLVVERDAAGAPVGLRPDREHPVSAGFACAKGTRFLEVARHPSRLTRPMGRGADGSLEALSWDAALDAAGARLRAVRDRHGPHAVGVYYGNPIAFNFVGSVALLQFLRALGTRNVFSAASQDCSNKFAGGQIVHGSAVIHPIPDLDHAELAVMLGTNPLVSQSSFVHLTGGALAFDRLVRRGGDVVWIDPRRTESARRWGRHLAIRPGADVWLILALLALLGDRPRLADARVEGLDRLLDVAATVPPERAAALTGLPEAEIRALADRIRRARATAFHMSVGVNQGPFGTLAYVALQALSYVTGNLDRAGGTLFHPLAPVAAELFRRLGVGVETWHSRVGGFPSVLDQLPGAILADEALTEGEGRIRALVVVAGDPLRSVPGEARLREALGKLECLVTLDPFENATGRHAHYLLPTTTWLERADVAQASAILQASSLAQTSAPVMPPWGESRHEAWILRGLRARMGLAGALDVAKVQPLLDRLPSLGRGLRIPAPKPGRYLGRGPRTPGHRVRFWDASLEPEVARLEAVAATMAETGFVLMSRRRRLGHNSWLHGGVRDGEAESAAWMAAEDLAVIGAESGGVVEIRTDAGAIRLLVVANADVRRGTVVVPHGLPEVNVNAIIPSGPAAVERVSGQHWMTGIPVTVAPAAPPAGAGSSG
jgi:formate dehydrogenase